jgi:putative NADH-flavin reductase
MTKIVVLGGTGFAGSHIVREALSRGWEAVAVARHLPAEKVPGATYAEIDIADASDLGHVTRDADALVVALRAAAPLGAGTLADAVPPLLAAAGKNQSRLAVIGGAGSSLVAPGGPRLVDTPDFPEAYKHGALSHSAVLDQLRGTETDVDWFYVSPAAVFGAGTDIAPRGTYRTGGDQLVVAADGTSSIAGEDLARAVVDEIEHPAHHRERFTIGY